MRRIDSDMFWQQYAALKEAARNGSLTEQMLDEAATTCIDDDMAPTTVFMQWVMNEPAAVKAFVATVPDAAAFFSRHIDERELADMVIGNKKLLAIFPEPERTKYICTVFLTHGARNSGWARDAIEAGVSRELVSELILDRLEHTVAERGMGNYVSDFAQGEIRVCLYDMDADEYSRDSYTIVGQPGEWAALDDEQFYKAFMVCAERSPGWC